MGVAECCAALAFFTMSDCAVSCCAPWRDLPVRVAGPRTFVVLLVEVKSPVLTPASAIMIVSMHAYVRPTLARAARSHKYGV